jgi:hypothetical protein
MWSEVDLNPRPLLRLSIGKLPATLAAYSALIIKQQTWRDNHRHIFATLIFPPPASLDLAAM